jgi:hypothetical protein
MKYGHIFIIFLTELVIRLSFETVAIFAFVLAAIVLLGDVANQTIFTSGAPLV